MPSTSDELLSFVKEHSPLLTAGTAIVSAVGLLPRFGPGLAAWLALRSRFARKPLPQSIRSAEIKFLKDRLAEKKSGQSYLVVTGEKGVGKSCLVSTVTSKMPGVIKIIAAPGYSYDDILEKTRNALTAPPFEMRPMTTATRVLFWYRLFTLGRSPIVVINAVERKAGDEYASLAGAVRTLVEVYKLHVIVDGSPNSLDETLLRTKRQRVLEVNPMTKELIWQLDQLQELFKYVKESRLEDTVFAVLGGNPADYVELWDSVETELQKTGQDPRQVIGAHLRAQVSAAIKLVKDAQDMEEIIKLFDKDKNCILSHLVNAKKLKRPTLDKVFREVKQGRVFVLIPASNAIGIVLRHEITEEPSLYELEELVKFKM